jgi:mannose-6-phosphate isomerase-like protein (cupin superfamily)
MERENRTEEMPVAAKAAPETDGERADGAMRVIANPVSGERIVIRQSGARTGGALLAFDLYLPPGGHVPARHVHPHQEERFTVISGRMRFHLGRRRFTAGPGATIVIPRGAAHWFGNPGPEPSHAYVETRPALRMEELFESTEEIGLAALRRGARLSALPDFARLLLNFQREVTVPNIPTFLTRAALTPLAWLSRWGARSEPERSAAHERR